MIIRFHESRAYTWDYFKTLVLAILQETVAARAPSRSEKFLANITRSSVNDIQVTTDNMLRDLISLIDTPQNLGASSSASTSLDPIAAQLMRTLTLSLLQNTVDVGCIGLMRKILAYAHLIHAFQQKSFEEQTLWLAYMESLSSPAATYLAHITHAFKTHDMTMVYYLALQGHSLNGYYWFIGELYQFNIIERALLQGHNALALFFKAIGVVPTTKTSRSKIYVFDSSVHVDSQHSQFKNQVGILEAMLIDVLHFSRGHTPMSSYTEIEVLTLQKKVIHGIWPFFPQAFLNPVFFHAMYNALSKNTLRVKPIEDQQTIMTYLQSAILHVHILNSHKLLHVFMKIHPETYDRYIKNSTHPLIYAISLTDRPIASQIELVSVLLPPSFDPPARESNQTVNSVFVDAVDQVILGPRGGHKSHYSFEQQLVLIILCLNASRFQFRMPRMYNNVKPALRNYISRCKASINKEETLAVKALRVIRQHNILFPPAFSAYDYYESIGTRNPLISCAASLWHTGNDPAISDDTRAKVSFYLNRSPIYHAVEILKNVCLNPYENTVVFIQQLLHIENAKSNYGFNILDCPAPSDIACKAFYENIKAFFFRETWKAFSHYDAIPIPNLLLMFAIMKDTVIPVVDNRNQRLEELKPVYNQWNRFCALPLSLPPGVNVPEGISIDELLSPKHPLQALLRVLSFLENSDVAKHKLDPQRQIELKHVYAKLLQGLLLQQATDRYNDASQPCSSSFTLSNP